MTTAKAKSVKSPAAASAQPAQWEGAFAAYGKAWQGMKDNLLPVLVFVWAYTVAGLISSIAQDGKAPWDDTYINYQDVLFLVFLVAISTYGLAVADKRMLDFRSFIKTNLFQYVSMLLVVILVALITGISFLLLIVPLIWAVGWFTLTPYVVVDKNTGPVEALKESKRISEHHKAKVWGIVGVSILISTPAIILGFVPYIGGAAVAFVTIWTAAAGGILYRWLKQQPQSTNKNT